MKNNEKIQALIADGTIGVGLGKLLTGKRNRTTTAVIARIAILASLEAREKAQKLNLPIIIVKNHCLYERLPNGSETFIKQLSQPVKQLPCTFKLK